MFRFLLVVCALVGAQAFYLPIVPRLDGRIVGGSPVDISQVPYQVALLLDWADTGVFNQACGGTIVRDNVILTVAHCPERTLSSQWRVRAGSTQSNSGGQVINVQRYLMHDNYDDYLDFDIGFMFLAGNINLGSTAAIATLPGQGQTVPDGADASVTGWGATAEGGNAVDNLQRVVIPIVNQGSCIQTYEDINPVTENMLCAGRAGQDACQGDSGGPLTVNGVLIGITSWGLGCARPGFPGVYTRVPAFRNWIDANINS